MKDLTLSNVKTSSKDIAEWTGKKHDAVVKDIRVILNDLYSEDASSQTHDTKKSKLLFNIKDLDGQVHEHKDNRNYTAFFELDDDHVNTLLTGYSTKARMAVNKELRLRRESESKPMTQMEIVVASAQALLEVERKQLALEQEQESIKDRLKAVEGKTDTVSKPKPAGYGSKDDLVLELKREFDVSGAVIEFVIKRYCGQYSDTYEYSYQKNEATFKDEAKCWQTDMVRAELETFLSETYPHKRKNCFTHDDYDGYFQWPSNKSNWKKSN